MIRPATPSATDVFDVLVIGAGFGGLGCALALSERGARVCICESLKYVGGCASTFDKDGYRFDAGATLLSGLDSHQPLGTWLTRYAPDVTLEPMDPLVELRTAAFTLPIERSRDRLLHRFAAMPSAPRSQLERFFRMQARVADTLWSLFDDPHLLPPFRAGTLARHLGKAVRYAQLAPLLGKSLHQVLAQYGLSGFPPLRVYLDALCQITVQRPSTQAEAAFALAAMDYYYRGTTHVRGGVGVVAEALAQGAEQCGAQLRRSTRVKQLQQGEDSLWIAQTRRGPVRARAVVANLLPEALGQMLHPSLAAPALRPLKDRVEASWGAAMLYRVVEPPEDATSHAHHLQLVADSSAPFAEGNHVFVSISGANEIDRAPAGARVLTLSTHVPIPQDGPPHANTQAFLDDVHERMRRTVAARAPEWQAGVRYERTASPRTFARFVGRPQGRVGGPPRDTGLCNYRNLGPVQPLPRLWLVGDSVFPGQSALAAAVGGMRTAEAITRTL